MSKKKILTSVVALGTAAALALGGTFAWQSINQTALNEGSDIVNPGGRLHDDFDGTNKDVYVENFADNDIFARVRLEEFFEIVLNAGTAGEKTVPVIGTKTPALDEDDQPVLTESGNPVYNYSYVTFKDYQPGFITDAGVDADGNSWWTWSTGGDTVFMPTFNKNKDSLLADINGEYRFDTGVITDKDIDGSQYTDMVEYAEDEIMDAVAVYDIDSNTLDELTLQDLEEIYANATVPEGLSGNVAAVQEAHTAKATPAASLISMADWLAAVEEFGYGEGYADCWVYDEDGWVYWSAPIKAGEATGLLLDGIELTQNMDDSWYYAINVVGQFVTANDVGKANNTGFYADGETVSASAATLLTTIGVDMGEAATPDEPEAPVVTSLVPNWTAECEDDTLNTEIDGDNLTITFTTGPDRGAYMRGQTNFTLTVYDQNNEEITDHAEPTYSVDGESVVVTSPYVLETYDGNYRATAHGSSAIKLTPNGEITFGCEALEMNSDDTCTMTFDLTITVGDVSKTYHVTAIGKPYTEDAAEDDPAQEIEEDASVAKTLILGSSTASEGYKFVTATNNQVINLDSTGIGFQPDGAQFELMCAGSPKTLTTGTDYTLEGSVLKLFSDGVLSTGSVVRITDGENKTGYVLFRSDNKFTLNNNDNGDNPALDGMLVTVDVPFTFKLNDGENTAASGSEGISFETVSTLDMSGRYTYQDGQLTITDCAGYCVKLTYQKPDAHDGSYQGMIFIQSAGE